MNNSELEAHLNRMVEVIHALGGRGGVNPDSWNLTYSRSVDGFADEHYTEVYPESLEVAVSITVEDMMRNARNGTMPFILKREGNLEIHILRRGPPADVLEGILLETAIQLRGHISASDFFRRLARVLRICLFRRPVYANDVDRKLSEGKP